MTPTHKLADGSWVFPDGYDPADLTPLIEMDFLEPAKRATLERVKALREKAKDGGIVTSWGPLETDPDSRTNINGAVQMATILGPQFSIVWRMRDNSEVTLNAAQMIQLGLLVGQHVSACQYRKNELDAAIAAAATAAELEAIDLEAGWPGS